MARMISETEARARKLITHKVIKTVFATLPKARAICAGDADVAMQVAAQAVTQAALSLYVPIARDEDDFVKMYHEMSEAHLRHYYQVESTAAQADKSRARH
jgi:hypothetical protein